MPTVLIIKGYRFFFFSNENNEPIHIHIEKGDAQGKVWLEPKIDSVYFYGFTVREQKEIMNIVVENENLIKTKWNEHFKNRK